jgi:hypothetical protein
MKPPVRCLALRCKSMHCPMSSLLAGEQRIHVDRLDASQVLQDGRPEHTRGQGLREECCTGAALHRATRHHHYDTAAATGGRATADGALR